MTKQVVNNQGTLLLQRHVDKSVKISNGKLRMLKFSIPQTGSLMYIELAKYDFFYFILCDSFKSNLKFLLERGETLVYKFYKVSPKELQTNIIKEIHKRKRRDVAGHIRSITTDYAELHIFTWE